MENYGSNSNYGYGYGYNGGGRPPFYNFFTPKDPLLNSDAKVDGIFQADTFNY